MALSTEAPIPGPRPHLDHIVKTIQSEFLEMPGLRLTSAQAQRLWNLDALVCDALFTALIDIGFIVRTTDGAFVRSDAAADRQIGRTARCQAGAR
jgi:hypothetical protein